jgi:hypothetical protein
MEISPYRHLGPLSYRFWSPARIFACAEITTWIVQFSAGPGQSVAYPQVLALTQHLLPHLVPLAFLAIIAVVVAPQGLRDTILTIAGLVFAAMQIVAGQGVAHGLVPAIPIFGALYIVATIAPVLLPWPLKIPLALFVISYIGYEILLLR